MTAPISSAANTLVGSVTALVDHIFDSADLAATTLTPRLQSRCLAVIVLAHAEIEEAIEEACRTAVRNIELHAKPDFHFLAWGLSAANPTAPSEKDFEKQAKAQSTIAHLASAYLGVVERSNGIKKKDLNKLLLPLGVDLRPLQADVESLNSFGERRGDAAHLSPLKAQLVEMPSSVRTRVVSAARSADAIVSSVAACAAMVASGNPRPPLRLSAWERIQRLMSRVFG